MAALSIRNLDDRLKKRLRMQAAAHGRSMEEEAREILRSALNQESSNARALGSALHELFEPYSDTDLMVPDRDPMRAPPRFD